MSGTITASAARTLLLPAATLDPDTILRWPTKSPTAVLDYTLDITAWLLDITDTLESFSVVVNSGNQSDLTASPQAVETGDTGMTVNLSGGTTGNEYAVTLTATSTGGMIDSWTVWVYVQNLGATLARQQPTTIGPPGQGFTYRGAWEPNTEYAAYDVLTNGGHVYECSAPFTSGGTFDASLLNLWM
jgi:hypothetical protein